MKRLLLTLCPLLFALSTRAADRIALVIGNGMYAHLPESKQLTSPVNDAEDVAKALTKLGYRLVTGAAIKESDRTAMLAAIANFTTEAKTADAAVFYYSGHGLQDGDDNYLLPADMPRPDGLPKLNDNAIQLRSSVMVPLEDSGVRTKVIILDCCRDNPFTLKTDGAPSGITGGIGSKSLGNSSGGITGYGAGFYLAFATSPGQTAADGNGERNSPFTKAFLSALPMSADKDIDLFFREVKAQMPADQVSWTNNSVKGVFSLAMPPGPLQIVSADSLQDGSVGKAFDVKLSGDVHMKFCYCPPGTFWMGSPPNESWRDADEKRTQVRISRGFWLAQKECTQAQWSSLMKTNPSHFQGQELPVASVSWDAVMNFILHLQSKIKLPPGWAFALPTEAQWEYACRAGTQALFSFGNDPDSRWDYANFSFEEGSNKKAQIKPPGSYPANPWGLYDMHGNVFEWCWDLYDAELPGGIDPRGSSRGDERLIRGGSFNSELKQGRTAFREAKQTRKAYNDLGFRVAIVPSSGEPVKLFNREPDTLPALFQSSPYSDFGQQQKKTILSMVQKKLKESGLYVGAVDGQPGSGTQNAILLWQRLHEVAPTANLDTDTLNSLGLGDFLPDLSLRTKPRTSPPPP